MDYSDYEEHLSKSRLDKYKHACDWKRTKNTDVILKCQNNFTTFSDYYKFHFAMQLTSII